MKKQIIEEAIILGFKKHAYTPEELFYRIDFSVFGKRVIVEFLENLDYAHIVYSEFDFTEITPEKAIIFVKNMKENIDIMSSDVLQVSDIAIEQK